MQKLSTASVPCPYYLILKTCQNESISDYIAASYGFKGNKAPACRTGEVLLRIRYVGFCGSDLNTYLGRNPMVRMPVIPGHEVGATIEVVGTDVPDFLRPGQNVTVNPYTNCGKCAACRNGRVNACEHNETFGVQRDGTMTEFVAVPWQKVVTADGLSARDCALVEPMSVGFHAVSRAQITDIDTVMVIGCGMIGLGAIVRAALRGAKVIAVDLDDEKLEVARSLGATCLLNSKTEDVHARLMEYTGGLGPDVVIEAVGSAPTYVMAVQEVSFTGRVVYIGYAKKRCFFPNRSCSCRRSWTYVVRETHYRKIFAPWSVICNRGTV